MKLADTDIWVVRAGPNGIYIDHFIDVGEVAIGWAEIGEIKSADSDADISRRFDETFPNDSPGKRHVSAGQVKRFVRDIGVGDTVSTYDPRQRLYHLGIIQSEAVIQSRSLPEGQRIEYVRRVSWMGSVPRDTLTTGARQTLTALLTLFRLSPEVSAEIRRQCSNADMSGTTEEASPQLFDDSDIADIFEEYIEKADQFVEDQISKLGPYQLQDMVAGVLRAMGYRTRVSGQGQDQGVDVFASPDGLGLTEPRILVEVKHRVGTTGAPEVRSFLGGRRPGDRCLYVSTGGFSREARYEAERSQIPLTLIDMPALRALLIDHYENIDTETRSLVPLRKIYWPIAD